MACAAQCKLPVQELTAPTVLLQAVAFSHAEVQARQDGPQHILTSDSKDTPEHGADIVTAEGGPRAPGRRIYAAR